MFNAGGDYVDDFAQEDSEQEVPEEKFESFISDGDSMLILGQPIDDQIKLLHSNSFSNGVNTAATDANVVNNQYTDVFGDEYYEDAFETPSVDRISDLHVGENSITFGNSDEVETETEPSDIPHHHKKKVVKRNAKNRKQTPKHVTIIENDEARIAPNRLRGFSSENQQRSVKQPATIAQTEKYKRIIVKSSPTDAYQLRLAGNHVIGSVVAQETKHDVVTLQKQLTAALKRAEGYRHEKEVLQAKLDSSGIESAVERYKALLIEKEARMVQLADENYGLKQIARFQSKGLVRSEAERRGGPERELSQDRQIEILMEHVRKTKAKMLIHRQAEEQLTAQNNALQAQNSKLARRINKLKRAAEARNEYHQPVVAAPQQQVQSLVDGCDLLSLFDGGSRSVHGDGPAEDGIANLEERSVALTDLTNDNESNHFNEQLSTHEGNENSSNAPPPQHGGSHGGSTVLSNGNDSMRPQHQFYDDQLQQPSVVSGLHEYSHIESSSSTITGDTRKPRRRAAEIEKMRRLQLEVEEERLYVLRQKEVILRLEKSIHKQRVGYQHELTATKAELQQSEQERRRLLAELDRREMTLKMQTSSLKQLRQSYNKLVQGNRRLLETKDLLQRADILHLPQLQHPPLLADDTPVVKPQSAPPMEPKPPVSSRPNSSAAAMAIRHNALLSKSAFIISDGDSDSESERDSVSEQGGNLTFLTSEIVE